MGQGMEERAQNFYALFTCAVLPRVNVLTNCEAPQISSVRGF